MGNFYTYVGSDRDKLYIRGYLDGKPVSYEHDYKPYLFTAVTPGDEDEGFRTIENIPVRKLNFDSMSDAFFFKRESAEVGRRLYGLDKWPYVYIHDTFPGEIAYDPSLVSVVGIDIETDSDEGFGTPELADKTIWTITLRKNGRVASFGYGDYTPHRDGITYTKCADESELLLKFLETWNHPDWLPDVITGWYIEFYDMPYLINRIRQVLGPKAAARLSPFRKFETRRFNRVINGDVEQHEEEVPVGISILDYMAVYKKFSFTMQESWKLDHIAWVVLKKRKLDYHELGFDNLSQFYHGNFQKFLEYNIIDIDLVAEMDEKLRLIEQVMAIAYDAHVNYIDSMTTVQLWDVMIHNYLLDRKLVVPFYVEKKKTRDNIGGYVKTPKFGLHKWVASLDLTSLYPHLDMQYNISPETLRGVLDQFSDATASIDLFLEGAVDEVRPMLLEHNYAICPTGCLFDRSQQGFFPAIMEKIFADRAIWKKRMIKAKQDFEAETDPEKKRLLDKEIARCWSMQQAKKIEMNSGYGALANRFFRWFDIRLAESITSSGQLAIRWAERGINRFMNKLLETKDVDYVIAMDTDSLYISLDALVQKHKPGATDQVIVTYIDKLCEEVLQPVIDKNYQALAKYTNAFQQKMIMKREAIANKVIWVAKKHYVMNVWDLEGVRYKEPELKLTGIEAVRSSTPMSCRTAIKEALQITLNKDEATLQKYIEDFRERFKTLPFEQVAFPRGVGGIDEGKYDMDAENQEGLFEGTGVAIQKGTPIHVKGSLMYNELLKKKGLQNKYGLITKADKIKFAYLLNSAPVPTNVIAAPGRLPKELDLDKYIDYNMQFEKAFLTPLAGIIESLNWQLEKTTTLEDLF